MCRDFVFNDIITWHGEQLKLEVMFTAKKKSQKNLHFNSLKI